jgi:hypothetical protein
MSRETPNAKITAAGIAILVLLAILSPTSSPGQNLLDWPESIVFDEQYNRYLLSNYNTGDVVAIDMDGNQTVLVPSDRAKQGLEIVGDVVYCGCGLSVRGWDLATGTRVFKVAIPNVTNLNDVAADNRGNLYVGDVYQDNIYRIHIADSTVTTFVDGLFGPNGIWFDEMNNRLLVCSFMQNSPIHSVSLEDSSVTVVTPTTLDNCDGICLDDWGYCYVSSWGTYSVHRFDPDFSDPPEVVYYSPGGPADIAYNSRDDILAIPLMPANSYDLVPVTNPTSVDDALGMRRGSHLGQNYPNPFGPGTSIVLSVPDNIAEPTILQVYDVQGRLVRTLVDGVLSSGNHVFAWDGRSEEGQRVAPGIYLCRLKQGSQLTTRKMMRVE